MTNNIEQLRQVASNQLSTSLAAAKAAKEAQQEIDRQEKLAAASEEALQGWLLAAMERQLTLGKANPRLAQEIVQGSENPLEVYLGFAFDLLVHPVIGYVREGSTHHFGNKAHANLDELNYTLFDYIGRIPVAAVTNADWLQALLFGMATETGTDAVIRRLSIMAAQKTIEGIPEPAGLTLGDVFKGRALLGIEALS